jgi:hypothetical protein
MDHAKTSVSREIFAGAIFSVVPYLAPLRFLVAKGRAASQRSHKRSLKTTTTANQGRTGMVFFIYIIAHEGYCRHLASIQCTGSTHWAPGKQPKGHQFHKALEFLMHRLIKLCAGANGPDRHPRPVWLSAPQKKPGDAYHDGRFYVPTWIHTKQAKRLCSGHTALKNPLAPQPVTDLIDQRPRDTVALDLHQTFQNTKKINVGYHSGAEY